ncbi:hypothetical protein [uncultured Mycolicibacterium sp.]|uniref:hypothetical protein n=1 Tax=uncultured Mycolicibacterium sp. TaxID=2320817 RepID=UPI0026279969|nr:hypothetical protein [uncultured Mycolicibacterium sp.]
MTQQLARGGAVALAAAVLFAAPVSAAPELPSDDRGFIDSTARCEAPADAVVFGRTAGSRVAICRLADGGLQYRGVRVRDGARLITAARADGDGYVAEKGGVRYTVTAEALTVTAGQRVIRDEPMVQFVRPGAKPSSESGASASAGETRTTEPAKPLPPPLPAEVGGSAAGG